MGNLDWSPLASGLWSGLGWALQLSGSQIRKWAEKKSGLGEGLPLEWRDRETSQPSLKQCIFSFEDYLLEKQWTKLNAYMQPYKEQALKYSVKCKKPKCKTQMYTHTCGCASCIYMHGLFFWRRHKKRVPAVSSAEGKLGIWGSVVRENFQHTLFFVANGNKVYCTMYIYFWYH